MKKLILASSSASRKALLEKLQIPFEIILPNIDETPLKDELPNALAIRLAETKARAVSYLFPNALIIGSDQVIMSGDVRLDKPETVENAIAQLQLVSGKEIISYTGLCLLNTETQHHQTGMEINRVSFRKLTQSMIEDYVARDNPLQCAGSIKAEGIGITLFTKMEGHDPTALLGLPLILLSDMLLRENITILGQI